MRKGDNQLQHVLRGSGFASNQFAQPGTENLRPGLHLGKDSKTGERFLGTPWNPNAPASMGGARGPMGPSPSKGCGCGGGGMPLGRPNPGHQPSCGCQRGVNPNFGGGGGCHGRPAPMGPGQGCCGGNRSIGHQMLQMMSRMMEMMLGSCGCR